MVWIVPGAPLGRRLGLAAAGSPGCSCRGFWGVFVRLPCEIGKTESQERKRIEQTWNFAHPENKKYTGPLPHFKMMIKGKSYQMLLNHISHTITEVGSSDKWAQFEVIILDKEKIYHKFNWQVEKYTGEGPLKDCWLTTMVSSPIALGSSI